MPEYRLNLSKPEPSYWEIDFKTEREGVKLFASDFLQPIDKFLEALRLLLKGDKKVRISLIDEPTENIIELEKLNEKLNIKIFEFQDYKGGHRNLIEGKIRLEYQISFNRFLNQFINSFHSDDGLESDFEEKITELIALRK